MVMGKCEYVDLSTVISFEDFDYAEYINHEKSLLQPRLEDLGYDAIMWMMGERDSFGPLTRICHARRDGEVTYFIYG